MKENKPTPSDIKKLLASRERLYATLRTEQAKDNRYYEGTDNLGILANSGYHEVRTGLARAIIDVPTHRLLGIPSDESEPRAQTETETRLNTNRRLCIKGIVESLFKQSPNPIKEAFKKSLYRGESYFQILLDESIWPDEPVRKASESEKAFKERHIKWEAECSGKLPFHFKTPDPMNVYPSQDAVNGIPRNVIVKYNRTAGEVKAKYPDWSNPRGKKDDTSVLWVEYWDKDWRGYWADWEPILTSNAFPDGIVPNLYGVVFVHMFGGYGTEDHGGLPETLARSILYPLRSLITAEQRAVSFQDSDVALHSHRTGEVEAPTEEAAIGYAQKVSTAPGMVRLKWEGGPQFKLDEPAPANQALFAQSSYLHTLIEQRTHISLLSGYAGASITSGVQQGMGISWARADYEDAIRNLEAGLSMAMGIMLRLIETVLKKPMTIRATVAEKDRVTQKEIVLKPEDIDGDYTVKMRFKTDDPSHADVLSMQGRILQQAGIISHRTNLVKYQGFDDADTELMNIAVERFIEENPILRQGMNQELARQWGLSMEEIQTSEAAELRLRTPDMYGGQPQSAAQAAHELPVRQYRRGLETPELVGGPTEMPLERREEL